MRTRPTTLTARHLPLQAHVGCLKAPSLSFPTELFQELEALPGGLADVGNSWWEAGHAGPER